MLYVFQAFSSRKEGQYLYPFVFRIIRDRSMKPIMDFRMLSVKPKFSVGCQVFSTWSVNWVHISGISSCPLFLLVVVQLAVAVVSEDRVGQEELLVSIPEQRARINNCCWAIFRESIIWALGLQRDTFCPCIFCIQEHKADIEEELLGGQAQLRLPGSPRLPRPAMIRKVSIWS